MGWVIVISLPVILLFLIAAIGCYLLGRASRRDESARIPQYYGPPAPPAPPIGASTTDK